MERGEDSAVDSAVDSGVNFGRDLGADPAVNSGVNFGVDSRAGSEGRDLGADPAMNSGVNFGVDSRVRSEVDSGVDPGSRFFWRFGSGAVAKAENRIPTQGQSLIFVNVLALLGNAFPNFRNTSRTPVEKNGETTEEQRRNNREIPPPRPPCRGFSAGFSNIFYSDL